jgi:hypothetical protein
MVEETDGGLRYLSDQYNGEVMGFEERGAVTLAQTPPLALGILAFGAGVSVPRAIAERFRWHVVDETLDGHAPPFGAESHGVLTQLYTRNQATAYATIAALSVPQAGIVAAEAAPDSALFKSACNKVQAAREALAGWGKPLFIDRILLSLLAGAPETEQDNADLHYVQVADALRQAVTSITGQGAFPHIIVSQSAGTTSNGKAPVILAEGRLDIEHPSLGFIVATPKYPFGLRSDMPGTHTAQAHTLIDEMETMALQTVHAGRPWHCPSLRLAWAQGNDIIADFSALSDLDLGPGDHGFHLEGCDNNAQITHVDLSGKQVILHCDRPPEGKELALCYAFGKSGEAGADRSANTGAVFDGWTAPSLALPGFLHRRFALSGRVTLVRGHE